MLPREVDIAARFGGQFRQLMIDGDIRGLIKLHAHVHPEQAELTWKEAAFQLHLARTQAESVPIRLRRYSDRWLRTRGFGSFLPHNYQLHPGERR